MSLFEERHAGVRVLYKAAGQLLDDAAVENSNLGRELCRRRAMECVELAEKIARMESVKITCDTPTSLEVEGIPFDLGFVVNTKIPSDPDSEVKDGN